MEASSPGPPRDPPDPGSSPRPDDSNATDTRLSDSPPPHKKQRRRSGTSVQSAEDTNETVLSGDLKETSVKNEPQEFNDEDDMLGHGGTADGGAAPTADIKADTSVNDDGDERNNFGISESVTISRSQAAMQQLQESFGSFLPAMSQSSGFLSHGATEMPRPPFPLEGVQGKLFFFIHSFLNCWELFSIHRIIGIHYHNGCIMQGSVVIEGDRHSNKPEKFIFLRF